MSHLITRGLPFLFFAALLSLTSCDDDDDPVIPNEEEVITDVVYTLTPVGGGDVVVLSVIDRDGDGSDPATSSQVGDFQANTEYSGSLQLLNVNDTGDVERIDAEVREEDDEHQVFYVVSGGLNATVTYADMDGDGEPLGLLTTMTTGASSSGQLTVTLIHEPEKAGDGNIISAPGAVGGSTDVEVRFDVSF